jgi:hypothetical protein
LAPRLRPLRPLAPPGTARGAPPRARSHCRSIYGGTSIKNHTTRTGKEGTFYVTLHATRTIRGAESLSEPGAKWSSVGAKAPMRPDPLSCFGKVSTTYPLCILILKAREPIIIVRVTISSLVEREALASPPKMYHPAKWGRIINTKTIWLGYNNTAVELKW